MEVSTGAELEEETQSTTHTTVMHSGFRILCCNYRTEFGLRVCHLNDLTDPPAVVQEEDRCRISDSFCSNSGHQSACRC
ncbi:uncharacterized protein DAT39_019698 [Clarias magur]|uniref:Uncharacterized protein n=1 Tax=Clarias magur TaxID=1594786 RepID=A0A8J4U461_CLAMG|nr:uncharacterized protein DAT39_019698 [Clarias magur]